MKTIVKSSEINKDEKLALVKAFRLTNKRAGEVKRQGPDGNEAFLGYCAQLRDLSEKANEMGFRIWVNINGQTGHTYEKDYKESLDELHNYDDFLISVQSRIREHNNLFDQIEDANFDIED